MMNYANAPEPSEGAGSLIPEGTLVRFVIEVRPHNLHANIIEKPNKEGTSRYLDLALTVEGGPYDRRKIFETIMTAHNENKGVQMGAAAIKAVLEANGASPQNPGGYNISSYMDLSGKVGYGKVKLEKGDLKNAAAGPNSERWADKNRIGLWISPIAASTAKEWAELQAQMGGQPPRQQQLQAAPQPTANPFQGNGYAPPNQGAGAPFQPQPNPAVQQLQAAFPGAQQVQPQQGVQHTAPLPWAQQQAPQQAQQQPPWQAGPAGWPAPNGDRTTPF